MKTVGEALVRLLEAHGVDTVFGIPGVHTIELYRGLAGSPIRHVTPRHEQAAGFMADGYARATGRPGVALLITGPGLTNAITAIAQARADSVPMLVISGVNRLDSLGRGLGHLHELPDQRALMRSVCLMSERVERPQDLGETVGRAFDRLASGRPGPVHIEIPLDVMGLPAGDLSLEAAPRPRPAMPAKAERDRAVETLAQARRPAILIGGGARGAGDAVARLAERLDAPVISAANARGIMHGHRLAVPASPSLKAVRALLAGSDAVLALGTEMGPTDYDVYADGGMPALANLVRVDCDGDQLEKTPCAVALRGDAAATASALVLALGDGGDGSAGAGAERARQARDDAWDEIGQRTRAHVGALKAIRSAVPGATIVGDSTQAIYAGNLFYDHDRPGGWFNAATGYGALGYGPPAAIGAALGRPGAPVICLSGDGGMQFVLAELGTAVDEGAPVIFVVWNNRGFQEIETSMRAAGIVPVGVRPSAPDFCAVATAYGMAAERIDALADLGAAVARARRAGGPALIELAGAPEL
ncbi:MAG: 5-guanidino-2-oxopentanoate decarboxylase [Nitratireductor sp.]